MTYLLKKTPPAALPKVPPKPPHECDLPDLKDYYNRNINIGSIWQCDTCGLVWIVKGTFFHNKKWKTIEKKKAAKILGFPVANLPQKTQKEPSHASPFKNEFNTISASKVDSLIHNLEGSILKDGTY